MKGRRSVTRTGTEAGRRPKGELVKRTSLVLAAVAVLILTGYVDGRWSNRWTTSHALADAVARLDRVALDLGDWEGRSMELSKRELDVAELDGYLERNYKNLRTGENISVLLVCGRPGPVAEHTPDVCYIGAGFVQAARPALQTLKPEGGAPEALFREEIYSKGLSNAPSYLRILWSLNATGQWQSPPNPRVAFAPRSFLYKLYVVSESASADESAGASAKEFTRTLLLPELQRALFSQR
jgi:hypothetical protein